MDATGVAKLQALYRGRKARSVQVPLAKSGAPTAPFYRTPPEVVRVMLEQCFVCKDDIVLDVGCGDGAILVNAASETGCTCIGLDVDDALLRVARRKAREQSVAHLVDFVRSELTSFGIPATFSVVLLFLVPSCLHSLRSALTAHLLRGGKIASYHFPLVDHEPTFVATVIHPFIAGSTTLLYIYRV